MADNVPRISPDDAHEHLDSSNSHLICAYDDEEKCAALKLEGSISLAAFEDQVDSIPNEAELTFYCK